MFSKNDVTLAFKEFVKQTSTSSFKIIFDDGSNIDYHISLNYEIEGKSIIKNDALPLFKIENLFVFLEKLTELLNLMYEFHLKDKEYFDFSNKNYLNYLLMSCITNMHENDFNYSLDYVNALIDAYNYNYNLDNKIYKGSIYLNNKKIKIYEETKKNIASMESPVYKQFIFEDTTACDDDRFYISPRVHYYTLGKKTYIKGIQNSIKVQKNKISKQLDRYFRKVDDGIDPSINISENGEVSNIRDVSPSFLVSLTLFIASFEDNQLFFMPDYLPLKYQNKIGVLNSKKEDSQEADRIQKNITNRFLLTGLRLSEHFDNLSTDFFNGYLTLKKEQYTHKEGNILYNLYETMKKVQIK